MEFSKESVLEMQPVRLQGADIPTIEQQRFFRDCHSIWYHLLKINWAVFGSITFKDERLRNLEACISERNVLFNGLLKQACKMRGLRRKKLALFVKHEASDLFKHHLHFLIAEHNLRAVRPHELAITLENLWLAKYGKIETGKNELICFLPDDVVAGKGTARIEEFDMGRLWNGVSYVTKHEKDACGNVIDRKIIIEPPLRKLMEDISVFDCSDRYLRKDLYYRENPNKSRRYSEQMSLCA